MKRALLLTGLLASLALLAAGCGGSAKTTAAPARAPKPHCAHTAGWQRLANQIRAAVYCPGWLPDPLTSQIGGRWNNINSVDPDRSYLESFVWQETGGGAAGGELHVNLRGYAGRTKIPSCTQGGGDNRPIPCFAAPHGTVRGNGIVSTLYTVNQDADQWHLLLAWRHAGSLYTVSEHVAPPLSYQHVLRYLKREFRSLVRIEPST